MLSVNRMSPKYGIVRANAEAKGIRMAACRTPNQGRREPKTGFRMAGDRKQQPQQAGLEEWSL